MGSKRLGAIGTSAVVVLGLISGLSAPAASSAVTAGQQREVRATGASLNWAGYVDTGSGITSTSANWRVPTLLTRYNGYSATWVGIDGAASNDPYLIQTGIEADVINHRASYYAWWEVITPTSPAPEVKFSTLAVRPGDAITGIVAKGSNGLWTMTIKNNTTKHSASKTMKFGGRGASAEWIVEDTAVNGVISTAPDWQSITFSSIAVNGRNPNLRSSQGINIVTSAGLLGLLGGRGIQETSTGAPNSTHNGFTVTWLATGTRTRLG